MLKTALRRIVVCLLIGGSRALAMDLPPGVAKKVEKAYPSSKILFGKSCRLGPKSIESFGVLIQRTSVKKGKNPLEALILYKNSQWNLLTLPHQIQYSKGSDSDFLRDYWTSKGFTGAFEIRCTSPKTDKDISTKANGVFEKFAASFAADVHHLCFTASVSYNSWNCFTYNEATSAPETSFIQMNAD